MEINPVGQSGVERRHWRDVGSRSINPRDVWDRMVDARLAEDLSELDAIWEQIIEDIGSEYVQQRLRSAAPPLMDDPSGMLTPVRGTLSVHGTTESVVVPRGRAVFWTGRF
ncbi:hypothetical protein ACFWXZ_28375 [[Kitasatospora] papulosa]|uniref:hypothetical protein n=1 Tax=[Kitasatospora] papulosa TaxID=1464011 RepID=UPI003691567E